MEQTITKKTMVPDQSVRTQDRETARTAPPKPGGTSAPRAKSISKRRPVKTKVGGKRSVAAARAVPVNQSIPGTATKHLQEFGQRIGSHADSEALAALRTTTPRDDGRTWEAILPWLSKALDWARKHLGPRKSRKRLRVCESVSLGEKRFVAVIEVDGEQFLVGGASSSVSTLARLTPSQEFSEVLKRRWAQDPLQA